MCCPGAAVEMLGAVAGNLALTQLPFGGIYLVGGVSRALAPYFDEFGFHDAFRDKGRFSSFMDSFTVQRRLCSTHRGRDPTNINA